MSHYTGHNARDVAVAILYFCNGSMHYEDIAKLVEALNLSGLGERGGKTTARTMESEMSTNKAMFIGGDGSGMYAWNRAYDLSEHRTTREVAFALASRYMKNPTLEQDYDGLKQILTWQNSEEQELRNRIRELEQQVVAEPAQ